MAANYVLLEKITVGAAGASSVTFSGIPQTGYTDLLVKLSLRSDRTADTDSVNMTVNGSAISMTWLYLLGNNSVASSATAQRFYTDSDYNTASTFGNAEVYIPNYASANYKSFSVDTVSENNAASGAQTELLAQLWSNTAAITSITFAPQFGSNWKQYSTFYLYGVAALGTTPVIVPYATGGDTIMTDGTYWYHAFKASGTFTPAKLISCDVLVVAGAGGANSHQGGGSGAGGVLGFASQSFSTAQTVTIGAGGAGASDSAANGTNSTFGSLTTTVGGGAGGLNYYSGQLGGSGGGGSSKNFVTPNYGLGTSGQGNRGGSGTYPSGAGWESGGGGGAGAVGADAQDGVKGGDGGAGTNSVTNYGSLTTTLSTTGLGVSGYIAGGGGGGVNAGTAGTGGSGGGGNGSASTGTAGTANTGSGAGGGGNGGSGSNGGSGLIIVRYAV